MFAVDTNAFHHDIRSVEKQDFSLHDFGMSGWLAVMPWHMTGLPGTGAHHPLLWQFLSTALSAAPQLSHQAASIMSPSTTMQFATWLPPALFL